MFIYLSTLTKISKQILYNKKTNYFHNLNVTSISNKVAHFDINVCLYMSTSKFVSVIHTKKVALRSSFSLTLTLSLSIT